MKFSSQRLSTAWMRRKQSVTYSTAPYFYWIYYLYSSLSAHARLCLWICKAAEERFTCWQAPVWNIQTVWGLHLVYYYVFGGNYLPSTSINCPTMKHLSIQVMHLVNLHIGELFLNRSLKSEAITSTGVTFFFVMPSVSSPCLFYLFCNSCSFCAPVSFTSCFSPFPALISVNCIKLTNQSSNCI